MAPCSIRRRELVIGAAAVGGLVLTRPAWAEGKRHVRHLPRQLGRRVSRHRCAGAQEGAWNRARDAAALCGRPDREGRKRRAARRRSTCSCSTRGRASPASMTGYSRNSIRRSSAMPASFPAGLADETGVTVAAQVVGIGYNPKKLPKPKGWADLFKEPFVSRLGLTGFQTTFGTVSIDRNLQNRSAAAETNVEPVLRRDQESPASDRRNRCAGRDARAVPAGAVRYHVHQHADGGDVDASAVSTSSSPCRSSGAIAFFTTMHLAKGAAEPENAYKYHRRGDQRRRCRKR